MEKVDEKQFDDLMEPYKKRAETLAAAFENEEKQRICDAFNMACDAHRLQVRKSGEPYICHPLETAEILLELGLDSDTIISGLLHDCIEDTDYTYEDVEKRFGHTVAELVNGVTKLKSFIYSSKEEAQMESLRKMFVAMANDIRVIIIKLADRLHNIRTIQYQRLEKQREISLETMEIYAPLAHRMGMKRIQEELEDRALRVLDPVGCAEIDNYLNGREAEFAAFMNHTKERMLEKLTAAGIKCDIRTRVKHLYSIYRKLYGQNLDFNAMYDMCASRIIVDTVFDCYNVFGLIHDLYKPVPGRFKDYISTPKPNGYQSLHTVVIGSEGIPFEVQIRTQDMDETAEYGIAAHWKYKDGLQGKQKEEAFAWVRQIIENQQDAYVEEFASNIKSDLFNDEVFVFTPKGDVISLPAGSTPIDLAYAIHSAVGNRMTGAKVNGKIVPIDYKLNNGEIVEIITGKNSAGPNRDWMQIVQTNSAKSKIRQWFKKEKKDENIEHGKRALDRELRLNLVYDSFQVDEIQSEILRKLRYQSVDELYASIGYGGITLSKVVAKVKDEVLKRQKERKLEDIASIVKPKKNTVTETGVIIEGIENCLVKFAKCCMPVPGDEVLGFITRGYGVSLHRVECPNVRNSLGNPEEYDRWLHASWNPSERHSYSTGLKITGKSRTGILKDVVTVLTNMKINVGELSVRDTDYGQSVFYITVTVGNLEQLQLLMKRLHGVKGVSDVSRNMASS